MLVRFVAVSLILFGLAELAIPLAMVAHSRTAPGVLSVALEFLPALIGVIMLVAARKIARWLADLLDN